MLLEWIIAIKWVSCCRLLTNLSLYLMNLRSAFLLCATIVIPAVSAAQSQKFKGYPQRHADMDVLPGFVKPPKGYGNVPFYWWSGDRLDKERLREQLDILSSSATDGFAVSYMHTDPEVDTLVNKNGHGLYGRTEPGEPGVFTEEWWKIWNWFSGESASRGMGAGLDDYTMGWVGNGYYPDELDTMSVFKGYKGELNIDVYSVKGGTLFQQDVPADRISVVAWPDKIELDQLIENGKLVWQAPAGKEYKVYVISAKPGHILHPEHGKALVDVYFNRFENRMDSAGRAGMNYFFQDELSYPIHLTSWSSDFQTEFERRKGYNITPYLPALKEYIGQITPKIRLDYAEVLMDLSEERYYRPVYDWHAQRGLIYGCDNLGRGRDPLAYVDYFRAISWFTAPGNDAPSRGSSFLETKVSSSIAHLYNRPRTWLEAFHSMGWGSSGAWLTQQIDHHFMAGGNLVCMHGLYYSTHGGWWEWAPPCFHFRMPYWPHMKTWLEYTERMSYLLSQGHHICDIALMYPTESMQAYPDATPDMAFDVAMRLSNSGLDYDFIDFRSLRDAQIAGGTTTITDERYRVLVLADMKAMHYSSLQKVLEHYRAGGIVLATGALPKASNRDGEQDEEVDKIVKEIFGLTAAEAEVGKTGQKQTNPANGIGWYIADGILEKYIPELITPDFIAGGNGGKVLHRKAGNRDVYMVMNIDKGSECFFRSTGKVELWNAQHGTTESYPVVRQTEKGTWLKLKKEYTNSYLFVFSPGTPVVEDRQAESMQETYRIQLDGEWEVELLPTLNNKWGDFRLPASDGYIGAEARTFSFSPSSGSDTDWVQPDYNDTAWNQGIYGYGPQAETYSDSVPRWESVSFSWQYGIWDNPGAQGYHGLKSKVNDGFFILDRGGRQQFRTFIYTANPGKYRIAGSGEAPDVLRINGKEVADNIYLDKGWHTLSAEYAGTKKADYKSQTGGFHDDRKRGAVVLLAEGSPEPSNPSIYSDTIAMRWTASDHLLFDPYGGKYTTWRYRFHSVPGLEEMNFEVHGKGLKIWIDGEALPESCITLQGINETKGTNRYAVKLPRKEQRIHLISFSLDTEPGYQGTGALAEPVKLITGRGLLQAGNWSDTGALHHYSGGMYYRMNCHLPEQASGSKVMLNLGDVVATCEVKVNGHPAGILMSPPYEADITSLLTSGENRIEILVYSTLSNHYQTIPTPYRGDAEAGLIGPVSLSVYR